MPKNKHSIRTDRSSCPHGHDYKFICNNEWDPKLSNFLRNEKQKLYDVYGLNVIIKMKDGGLVTNDLDYIFSLNFQHINKVKTKIMTGNINMREGYKPIYIASPMEV